MAAYATDAQVATEAKVSSGFSTTTNPTAAKVDEIIAEVEAKINSRLIRKYVLPLTQADSLLLLRGISLALCVERVREIMTVQSGTAKVEQFAAKTSADYARKDLERIVAGELALVGETLKTSGDGVKSFAKDTGLVPTFDRTKRQW